MGEERNTKQEKRRCVYANVAFADVEARVILDRRQHTYALHWVSPCLSQSSSALTFHVSHSLLQEIVFPPKTTIYVFLL